MSFTPEDYLPTEDELKVERELDISGPILKAGAVYLGKACELENNEFMLCREETKDPRACLQEGKAVSACALKFFRKVRKTCMDEFKQYYLCVDQSSTNSDLIPCRKTQAVFDKCVYDYFGYERPPFDHFARVHVHKTTRPEPIKEKIEFPDKTPYLSPDAAKPYSKHPNSYSNGW